MEITQEIIQIIAHSVPGNVAVYRFDGTTIEPLYLSHGVAALNGMEWDEYEALTHDDPTSVVFPEDIPAVIEAGRTHTGEGGYL